MQHLLRSLLVVLGILAAGSAHAQWRLISDTDAMTDRQMKIALTFLPDFGGVAFYRVETGEVMMNLRLALPATERFGVEAVMVRFDKNPAHTLAAPFNARSLTDYSSGAWEPRSIQVRVWDGRGSPRSNAFINQLLSSTTALVRFTRSDGNTRDVTVSLEGASKVVQQALSIPNTSRGVAEEGAEEKLSAWSMSIARCRESADPQGCIIKFTDCYAQFRGQDDKLLACARQ